jgi:hypothetical protein
MCDENPTENEGKTTVADRLPELSEDNLAGSATNAAWAAWYGYGGAEQGKVFREDLGISLQAVSNRIVRCLSVGDHPACYLALACMAHSFELVGVEFQLDPYTIPRPAPPEGSEKPPTTEPGLEVA